jgi:glycosyltransferase involved in cell wall biosynthesis
MRISVGLPVYDGRLTVPLASCLLTETSLALQMGDTLNVRFLASCTNLAFGRNCIVEEFLASDDDRLVFLDSDVTFEPGALIKIAHHNVDVVGGAYRLKEERERYPIALLNEAAEFGPGGLVQVAMVPTGFLSLSRDVFSRFREHYPDRQYDVHGKKFYSYFQIPFRDGSLYTEDAYFCREWREKGEKIYLDPEISLTHWQGNVPYPGHIGNWYRKLHPAIAKPECAPMKGTA